MKIITLPVSDLHPADYNPRKDLAPGDKQYDKLARSIETFGYVEPIVWNRTTGNIVGGHQRLKVLVQKGYTEVQVVEVELNEQEERILNVSLNKISGRWDNEKLTAILDELKEAYTEQAEQKAAGYLNLSALNPKMSTYQLSNAYKELGQIYDQNELKQKALDAYREGLRLNPGLPVKKRIKQLEKELNA